MRTPEQHDAGIGVARMTGRWPFLSADRRVAGFVTAFARVPEPGSRRAEGLFIGPPGGALTRVADAPSVAPLLDDRGRHLYLAYQLEATSRISVLRLDAPHASPMPLVELPGTVQQLALDARAGALVALVAQPGADTAALSAGRRSHQFAADPELDGGGEGAQRLWSVGLETGRASEIGPRVGSVWECAVAPDGSIAVIFSPEAGEAAWYSAALGRLDPLSGSIEVLYRPRWQLGALAVAPESGEIALVEAWTSDRGLTAGAVVVLAADGRVQRRIEDLGVDVTHLSWGSAGRLLYAGWRGQGTAWGVIEPGGGHRRHEEHSAVLGAPWHPSLAIAPEGDFAVACRSSELMAPEVAIYDGATATWRTWQPIGVNDAPALVVHEVSWQGPGGEEIEGILLVPDEVVARAGAGGRLVVHIHGGPSLAWHHAFDLARANALVVEGFSVLFPNVRGGVGRGDRFSRANHGDPGGAELEDALAGARWAEQAGLVAPGPPAVMGASYGGYLSALAAVTHPELAAAVVTAGMSDLASCRHTANNAPFYDLLLGAPPSSAAFLRLAAERSAVSRLGTRAAPTLILHGAADTCVPVTQARELYSALRSIKAEVEMAIYPREGHQMREEDHLADSLARTIRFLKRNVRMRP